MEASFRGSLGCDPQSALQLAHFVEEAGPPGWQLARDQAELDKRLQALRDVAQGDGNLLPPIKEALRSGGSIGDVCNAMRDVFGEYRGGAFF